jgi:hypothetical protein
MLGPIYSALTEFVFFVNRCIVRTFPDEAELSVGLREFRIFRGVQFACLSAEAQLHSGSSCSKVIHPA